MPTVELEDIGPGGPTPVVQPIDLEVRLLLEQAPGAGMTHTRFALARTVVSEPPLLVLLGLVVLSIPALRFRAGCSRR